MARLLRWYEVEADPVLPTEGFDSVPKLGEIV
jgi:hypothetical protein